MLARSTVAALVGILLLAGGALAADKEVKAKLVSVDVKKMTLTVTHDGKKVTYDVNEETKFLGPKGGASEKGIKDDRLVKDVELKLVLAGNNRTLHEVHMPERKAKDKDK